MKILICDDSMFVRKKMKDAIKAVDPSIEMLEAANGRQAVEKYKSEKPDLVFMDIIMPEESGVDALSEIMNTDKNAKVVMASSVGTQENLKQAILMAYDFLQKPIENADVARIIAKASE